MHKLHQRNESIARVAIALPVYQLFDYLIPENILIAALKPGMRLEVPFGKGKKIAFLIAVCKHSEHASVKLKSIAQVLDETPLINAKDLKLLHWASHYYHHPLGEVISAAFPAGLRQGKTSVLPTERFYKLTELGKNINLDELKRSPKQKKLLEKFHANPTGLAYADMASNQESYHLALKQLLLKEFVELDLTVSTKLIEPPRLTKQDALVLNSNQQLVVDTVCAALNQFRVYLLEGVTGSGKTEVYMQIIFSVLQKGQQVLVLLPEITLTPQFEQRFRERFAVPIAVSHSKLTDNQRQHAWLQMQKGSCAIMLGTRSALFTPLKNPGLIILDEEHDTSFKQQEGFRFSARDVAVMRAKLLNIPVVLGSATPALESLHNSERRRYQLLELPDRAGNAVAPTLQVLDIRNKKMLEGLSEQLILEMNATLGKNEQILLFLNRRGFAPTLICHGCGWVARCQRCDANLVIHQHEQILRCHHCSKEQQLLGQCPACKVGILMPLGLGTERVEKILAELFADKVIVRLDRDTTQRKGVLEQHLSQINQGHVDIILGTQMLAKGHHFPNVTLVVILDVDSGLFSIDFHAAEKLAQQIIQVSGRAGRAEKPGKVILQTRRPEHPLLLTLIKQGYKGFAKIALAERKQASLPPFSYQALFRAQALDGLKPQLFLQTISKLAKELTGNSVQVMGPVAAPMAKRAGLHRFQLLFQSDRRQDLHELLDVLVPKIQRTKLSKQVRWSLDIDPVDLF
jgi:primosomal protein N' (replication factor Y) (superfamily II helicase)